MSLLLPLGRLLMLARGSRQQETQGLHHWRWTRLGVVLPAWEEEARAAPLPPIVACTVSQSLSGEAGPMPEHGLGKSARGLPCGGAPGCERGDATMVGMTVAGGQVRVRGVFRSRGGAGSRPTGAVASTAAIGARRGPG